MKILLSIKPEYVQKIISGAKKFEYRKVLFKRSDITTIVVYATKPIGKIVGEFTIDRILSDTPEKIWAETQDFSGVSSDFYFKYFYGKKQAHAIGIKEFKAYPHPIDPYQKNKHFTPPQSYKYIVT